MSELKNRANGERLRIAARWKDFEGETRVAVMRVVSIIVLYGIQLLHRFCFAVGSIPEKDFHKQATWIACSGLFISLGVLVLLLRPIFPSFLKYVTTSFDLALVTIVAWLGPGSHSSMILIYPMIIAMAALRFNLPLIWFATFTSMACYMLLVGASDNTWFDSEHATKPIDQLITIAGFGGAGLAVGQIVRLSWRMEERLISIGKKGAS